jgi:hypothetical protein
VRRTLLMIVMRSEVPRLSCPPRRLVEATVPGEAILGLLPRTKAAIERHAPRHSFERQHPCPPTGRTSGRCPGYVVDHVKPLECGGADSPGNMQWQTVAAGKTKDKIERNCRLWRKGLRLG